MERKKKGKRRRPDKQEGSRQVGRVKRGFKRKAFNALICRIHPEIALGWGFFPTSRKTLTSLKSARKASVHFLTHFGDFSFCFLERH